MIPFFDPRPGYRALKSEIDAAIQRVLLSGRLILGPECAAFEDEFAKFVGSQHAVGVGSGTEALALAFRALGLQPGDEVITVSNAGAPPIAAIRSVAAVPRFVDVVPGSLVMDPAQLPAAVGPRTRCVLPVHLYGHPAPMDAILAFAQAHNLAVVEDCAHAHGARWHGREVGTFGAIGCFSFYPTKILGAFGDGGMCVTDDPALADRLRSLRVYGFRGDGEAHEEGTNSRLDEMQAAVLRVKLAHLPDALTARRRLAAHYRHGLDRPDLTLPEENPAAQHAYHLYVVQCIDRARVMAQLQQHAIGFGIHYPIPAHAMEAYRRFAPTTGALTVSERAAGQVLSLPLFPELRPSEVDVVINALSSTDTRLS